MSSRQFLARFGGRQKATLEKHFAQELLDGANEAKHLVSEFILNTILGRENGLRDDRSRATLAISTQRRA